LARKTSDPGAPWAEKRNEFLKLVLPDPEDPSPDAYWRDVESRGRELYELGCREPVVLLHYFLAAAQDQAIWRTGRKLADETCTSLRQAAAPAAALLPALTQSAIICRKSRDFKAVKSLDAEASALLPKLCEDGSFLPDEQPQLVLGVLALRSESLKRQPESILAWLDQESRLEPWAEDTLRGEAYVLIGWKQRGGDWASKVTDEGWKGFAENLELARRHLREAWQAKPDRPYAAARMITVAMAGVDGENTREWFDRAVAVQVDYLPAYSAYRWALRPRWGGSHEELLAFGEECLQTGRFDTIVPGQFDKAVDNIVEDYKDNDRDVLPLYRRPEVSANLCKLGRGLLKEPLPASELANIAARHAAMAWAGDLYKDAGDFLAAATPASVENQLPFFKLCGVSPGFFRSDLAIRLRHPASPYFQAEDPHANLSRAKRIELYRAAIKQFASDNDSSLLSAAPMFRLKPLEWEEAYERGEWAQIPVEDGLPGWKILAGDWRHDSGNSLAGRIGPDEAPLIHWNGVVGPNYEIHGEVDIIPQAPKLIRMAGMILGARPRDNEDWIFYELWNDLSKQTSTFLKKMDMKSQKPIPTPLTDANSVHIACWDGKLWVKVNGQTIHQGATFDPEGIYLPGRPDGLIGFGCHFNFPRTTMIFKNWSARRLTAPPSETDFPVTTQDAIPH
jgi:hypothetical protein